MGSSGVLHGMLAAGTLAHLKRREPEGWVLAGLLVAQTRSTSSAWARCRSQAREAVVLDAHLYGVIGGLAAALALKPRAQPL